MKSKHLSVWLVPLLIFMLWLGILGPTCQSSGSSGSETTQDTYKTQNISSSSSEVILSGITLSFSPEHLKKMMATDIALEIVGKDGNPLTEATIQATLTPPDLTSMQLYPYDHYGKDDQEDLERPDSFNIPEKYLKPQTLGTWNEIRPGIYTHSCTFYRSGTWKFHVEATKADVHLNLTEEISIP